MNLTAWDLPTDTFDYSVLSNNFVNIDKHDHSTNGGAKIGAGALGPKSVDGSNLADGSVDTLQLKNRSVTRPKIKKGIVPEEVLTVLPTVASIGSEDGYEVYLQTADMIKTHRIWHLRYSANQNVWQFLGGSPSFDHNMSGIFNVNNRSAVKTTNYDEITFTDTGSVSVVVPPGKYHVIGTARGSQTFTNTAGSIMYLAVGSSRPTTDNYSTSFSPPYEGLPQTNMSASLTVVNEITSTSRRQEIFLWGDAWHVDTTGDTPSNFTICSISATPFYLTAT